MPITNYISEKFALVTLCILQIIYSIITMCIYRNKKFKYINSIVEITIIVITLVIIRDTWIKTCFRNIVLAFPIAYALYISSLLIVGNEFNKNSLLFWDIKNKVNDIKLTFEEEVLRNTWTSVFEELIYRGVIQFTIFLVTSNVIFTVLVSSIYFTAIHFKKKLHTLQKIDIFAFSLIISTCFQITFDIWFVALIHIFRNLFVICHKYNTLSKKQIKMIKISKSFSERTHI